LNISILGYKHKLPSTTKVIAISKTLAGCDDQERHIKSCGDAPQGWEVKPSSVGQ
jgi:hypothetical protein